MGFLDNAGLTHFTEWVKEKLNGKQNNLTAGSGIGIQNDTIQVNTPVKQILTQSEFNALTEQEKANGLYVISDAGGSSGGSSGDMYSTEEIRIGTWIDGKPLYRTTFTTKFQDGAGVIPGISIQNVNIVTHIFGTLFRSDGGYIPIPSDYTDGSIAIIYFNNSLVQYPNLTSGFKPYVIGQPMYITIEYTKTTD